MDILNRIRDSTREEGEGHARLAKAIHGDVIEPLKKLVSWQFRRVDLADEEREQCALTRVGHHRADDESVEIDSCASMTAISTAVTVATCCRRTDDR